MQNITDLTKPQLSEDKENTAQHQVLRKVFLGSWVSPVPLSHDCVLWDLGRNAWHMSQMASVQTTLKTTCLLLSLQQDTFENQFATKHVAFTVTHPGPMLCIGAPWW